MIGGAGFAKIQAHCLGWDADDVPADFDRVDRRVFSDRILRTRSFMLERDNMPRTTANLARMRQRLFAEGSCIAMYETGEQIVMAASAIDITITNATLFLQEVLANDTFSHLTKIPICIIFLFDIWRPERSELAAVLQESMDNTDFRAAPATQEAIDTLEKMKPDKSRSEGDSTEACSICLEEMNALDVEVARMPCKHSFHYGCIGRWLNTSNLCPLCRFPMPTDYCSC